MFPVEGAGRLYVPEFAPPDVFLLEAAGLSNPVFQNDRRPFFAVYALPVAPVIPVITPTVTFAEAVTLLGYQVLPRVSTEPYQLLTYWRVEPFPEEDSVLGILAIFVHLVRRDGTMVAQADRLDAAAMTLQPGDIFIQLNTLTLPESLPGNTYSNWGLPRGLMDDDSPIPANHPII